MKYKISQLGSLEVVEVYDYFDGPKFYTVRDVTGRFYTVYWCDLSDEGEEGWLYLPISEQKLDELRRKHISAHNAYADPEIGYWLVYTKVRPRKEESVQFCNKATINNEFFPPQGMYVEHIDVIEKGGANWDHELYIEKNSSSTPSAEVSTEVFGLWTSIVESIMNVLSKTQQLHIASALPGSLEIKVGSSNPETTYEALVRVAEIVEAMRGDNDLVEHLYAAGIEPYKLKSLFDVVKNNKLKITVTPRLLDIIESPIVLDHEMMPDWIARIEPLTSRILGTDKIPQADEISKILDIINYKINREEITSKLLGITERQVRYYEDAAENLGVLDKNRNLTSIGYFVGSQESDEEKYSALAIRFESSDCGWSWIKWSGVSSLIELNEDTAADFLIAVAPGLSESTARRRASTLKLWLRKLRPYHYKYVGLE